MAKNTYNKDKETNLALEQSSNLMYNSNNSLLNTLTNKVSNALNNASKTIADNLKTENTNYHSPIMSFGGGFGDPRYSLNPKHIKNISSKYGNTSNNTSFDITAIPTRLYKDNSSRLFISDISKNKNYEKTAIIHKSNKKEVYVENPFEFTPDALDDFNKYRFIYKKPMILDEEIVTDDKDANNLKGTMYTGKVVPSLFTPNKMIHNIGISANVPLTTNLKEFSKNPSNGNYDDISDCSIKTLVNLSRSPGSILGHATYTYADFMYCKDLGKVSNNHLITLRRFPYPVGDDIFESTKYEENKMAGDIGRLVTWFDTEDNKLENILHYTYKATWKDLHAEIQQIESQENDKSRGILGTFINITSASYNKGIANGTNGGSQSLWGYLGLNQNWDSGQLEKMRMYDKNKVYEPKNTIQDTHIYEGKLEFTHSFSLTFSYKLRAYDNVNPKSAMLDLIGNILNVTYRRGKFWGGSRRFIGPPPNTAQWNKVNAFIDNAWDKLGGIFGNLANFDDFQSILGAFSGAVSDVIKQMTNAAKSIAGEVTKDGTETDAKSIARNSLTIAVETAKKYGWGDAAKGALKNALGRPAFYAMNSLLSGDNVGLWHLTIGNPKNPIAVMGNLILENAEIIHSGPLGIDDFPTEIKVVCTLKHARSRDATEIGKMYTKGVGSIQYNNRRNAYSDFLPHTGTDNDFNQDMGMRTLKQELDEERARQNAAKNASKNTKNSNVNNEPSDEVPKTESVESKPEPSSSSSSSSGFLGKAMSSINKLTSKMSGLSGINLFGNGSFMASDEADIAIRLTNQWSPIEASKVTDEIA